MTTQEGVIKFVSAHTQRALTADEIGAVGSSLLAWHQILRQIGLIGADPRRYDGLGYGNLSARLVAAKPRPAPGQSRFLITGSQTGQIEVLGLDHLCIVEHCDVSSNRVRSEGPRFPSSESMTHGAIYQLSCDIQAVLHVHSPDIWQHAARLRVPTTAADVPYGTAAMASEMRRLYLSSDLPQRQILSMAGHEDGVIAFGGSLEAAGCTLLAYLARAYELRR